MESNINIDLNLERLRITENTTEESSDVINEIQDENLIEIIEYTFQSSRNDDDNLTDNESDNESDIESDNEYRLVRFDQSMIQIHEFSDPFYMSQEELQGEIEYYNSTYPNGYPNSS